MSVELSNNIARWTEGVNRFESIIPGLVLHRWESPNEPTSYMMSPSICMIAQGRKRVILGEETYIYDTDSLLVTSVDLPLVGQILEASPVKPYLGLTLKLDLREIAQLMVDRRLPATSSTADARGIAVSQVAQPLKEAVCRLVKLLDEPDDVPVLAPLIQREIFYRLLVGEQGPRLKQMVSGDSRGFQVSRAIEWLKDNFDKPVRVEDLANQAGMSSSTLHNHFRTLTSMSPMQFQKRLRLNEARRLMLTEHADAATAAYQVGYESPSQFSREYSRLFGLSPMRDIKNLKQTAATIE